MNGVKARIAVICLAIVALFGVSVGSAAAQTQVGESTPVISAQEQMVLERIAALPETATQADVLAAMGVVNGQVPNWVKEAVNPDGFWEFIKCQAAILLFAAGNAFLITKISKIGGIVAAVKRVLSAGSQTARLQALIEILGEFTGINAVLEKCSG